MACEIEIKSMSLEERQRAGAELAAKLAAYIAPNPSARNPQISRDDSIADRIEAQLQEDGHKIWGFVIYRSTYADEIRWQECLQRLRWHAADNMELCKGQDMLKSQTWTIFEDQSLFDGVPTATIRQHFKDWCHTAVAAEQGTANVGRALRYHYCVQIDSEALNSILRAPGPPDWTGEGIGWVKLITKDWLPVCENPILAGRVFDDQVYKPIEGVTERHVGWIKCPAGAVMVEYYSTFLDRYAYPAMERRPPALIGYPDTY